MSRPSHELMFALHSLSRQIPSMEVGLIWNNRLIRQLANRTTVCFNECLKQHGLTESLWYALLAVYARKAQQILPSELSEILDLTRTSATRLSDDMVQQGWVVRHSHEHDRRKIMLRLTPLGMAKIHSVSPHIDALRHRVWSVLDETEHQHLQTMLQKLLDQLGETTEAAALSHAGNHDE